MRSVSARGNTRESASGSPEAIDTARAINGRYELIQAIDADELRTRYLARDLSVDRTVVAEVFSTINDLDANLEGRLLRRLGRIAQLRAPGIPRLLDGGLGDQAGPFIVTEPVSAPPLRFLLRDPDRLGAARVSAYGVRIARTLHAAHDRGLVHGRLRPENIHLNPLGDQAWVLGWLDGAMPLSRTRTSGNHTPVWPYLAPEYFRDELIGPAADVYGLAAVIHEMLTGQRPQPGRIRTGHSSIPKRLQPVLKRALDSDPGRRWASAEAFAVAIEEATPAASTHLAAPPTVGPAAPGTRSSKWATSALASMLALFGTLLAFVLISLGLSRFVGDAPPIVKGAVLSVPSVVGKTVDESRQMASDQEMELIVVGDRESDRYPAGQIMHQSPIPGWRPYEKQPIRVTVSSGVVVPNLVGLPITEAAKQANQVGWKIARVDTAPVTDQERAMVLIQSPAPRDLVPGPGEIALVVGE